MMYIIGIIVLLALILMYYYNSLVSKRNHADEAWSDISIQMKRRYNIIPNLIETVKGYTTHESQTFEKIVQARNAAMSASDSPKEMAGKENMLSGALKSIFALSESYPDLKANENFMHLQSELVDAEDKLQASRRFYNSNVRDLNTMIEQFPSNFVANMFSFTKKEFFMLDESEADAASKVPEVKF